MQCLSVSLSWMLGKHKILGDKPKMQKIQGKEPSGYGALTALIVSDSPRALETPPHLKYDLLWESRGVCPCKLPNSAYGRGLKTCFQHITQSPALCSLLAEGPREGGIQHSSPCLPQISQQHAMKLLRRGVCCCRLSPLCFWREFGIFFKKAHPREGEAAGWDNSTASLSLCALPMPSTDLFFLFFACWLWGPGDRTSLLQGSICSCVVLSAPSPSVWKSLCPMACAGCPSSWFSTMYSQVEVFYESGKSIMGLITWKMLSRCSWGICVGFRFTQMLLHLFLYQNAK